MQLIVILSIALTTAGYLGYLPISAGDTTIIAPELVGVLVAVSMVYVLAKA